MDENENGARAGTSGRTAGRARSRRGRDTVHGAAVLVAASGVLILGPSGSGKSGLALRLMALGADLLSDDRVCLWREGQRIMASAPEALAGLVEARGVGLLRLLPGPECAALALVVDLEQAPEARMPQRRKIPLLGVEIDLIYGRGVPNLESVITVLMHKNGVVI